MLALGACSLNPSAASPTTVTAAPSTPVETSVTMGAEATTTSAVPTTSATVTQPVPFGVPAEPQLTAPPPPAGLAEGFDGSGTLVVAAGGAEITSDPDEQPFAVLREGVVLPALGRSSDGEWVRTFDMCDNHSWVRADQVEATPPAPPGEVGDGFSLADAVIVVDAGHGGPNLGGRSPDGLVEKSINVDIAARVRDLLSAPRGIDWETGTIEHSGDIPAAGRVILTRVGDGAAADYEAGLNFRAAIANSANAHALVSIHNNAGWEFDIDAPGSDVYYQSQEPVAAESRRLATLLVEEFRRSFAGFDADWVGTSILGAKSRLRARDNSQYYGILKATDVPAVIAEGAYIANPSEADLLRTPEFRQAYADAVYRALVRFLTTDAPGDAPNHDPVVWTGQAGRGGAQEDCTVPTE